MQRLTEKTKDCFGYRLKDGSDSEVGFFKNYDAFYSHMMMVRELGEYEDLEEQGLLLRLPCKVGDTVYFTCRRYDRKNNVFVPLVHSGYVKAIKLSARPLKITVEYEDLDDCGRCKGSDYHASNIGKTVFLTKEEAEAKLREMEAGE